MRSSPRLRPDAQMSTLSIWVQVTVLPAVLLAHTPRPWRLLCRRAPSQCPQPPACRLCPPPPCKLLIGPLAAATSRARSAGQRCRPAESQAAPSGPTQLSPVPDGLVCMAARPPRPRTAAHRDFQSSLPEICSANPSSSLCILKMIRAILAFNGEVPMVFPQPPFVCV